MGEQAREQCAIEAGRILFCEALDQTLEEDGRGVRYQGLKLVTLRDMRTGRFSRTMVVVKSGQHSKRGIFANYCPFCGAEIVPEPRAMDPEPAHD